MRNWLLAVVVCLFMTALGEGGARLVDRVEVTDLSFSGRELERFRVDWHHGRAGGLPDADLWRVPTDCARPNVRIILGGDSWMQDPVFGRSLLTELQARLDDCVEMINTGTGSYGPSVIGIRVSNAAKETEADLVLIHIDETDLMDEWIRYKTTLTVDEVGLPVKASPFVPDLPDMIYAVALDVMSGWRSYLARLVGLALARALVLPAVRGEIDRRGQLPSYQTIMAPQRSPSASRDFAEQIEWFKARLAGMIRLARESAPEASFVIVSHPHYLHVAGDPDRRYKFSVDDVLQEMCAEYGVMYFSARANFREVHPGPMTEIFRWPGDPFSHLTASGAREYGSWVARMLVAHGRMGGGPLAARARGGA